MNAKSKDKFRRRLNAYAREHRRALQKDMKRLRRRADRLIEDIYYTGYGASLADEPVAGKATEAGVADVIEFHKAAGGKR